jgi:phasin family protein
MSRNPTPAMPSRASTATARVVDDAPVTASGTFEPIPRAHAPTTLTAITLTPVTLTQGTNTMINSTKDFVALGNENLEALTASSKIWAAGIQDLTQQIAATAKASLEETVATVKALGAVKTPQEAIELQSTYYKTQVAKALAETTKLTDATFKLTEKALAPLTARVAVAVEGFSKAA